MADNAERQFQQLTVRQSGCLNMITMTEQVLVTKFRDKDFQLQIPLTTLTLTMTLTGLGKMKNKIQGLTDTNGHPEWKNIMARDDDDDFYTSTTTTTTNQMNSRQMEQNVGCLKNVAINLCPLTWWTRRFRAPRRLCIGPSFSLNILSFGNSVNRHNQCISNITHKLVLINMLTCTHWKYKFRKIKCSWEKLYTTTRRPAGAGPHSLKWSEWTLVIALP